MTDGASHRRLYVRRIRRRRRDGWRGARVRPARRRRRKRRRAGQIKGASGGRKADDGWPGRRLQHDDKAKLRGTRKNERRAAPVDGGRLTSPLTRERNRSALASNCRAAARRDAPCLSRATNGAPAASPGRGEPWGAPLKSGPQGRARRRRNRPLLRWCERGDIRRFHIINVVH